MRVKQYLTLQCVCCCLLLLTVSSCEESYQKPKANFTLDVGQNGVVQFTNSSTDATEYEWSFGDDNSDSFSFDQNPQHIYPANGTFEITLIVKGPGGVDQTTKPVTIESISTELRYTNKAFTPITITAGGQTKVLKPTESFAITGKSKTSASATAFTNGATSTGTQIGARITWTLTNTFPNQGSEEVPLNVDKQYFFLELENASDFSIKKLYVNYGLQSETVENITVAAKSTTTGIGYYKAFTNSNIRVESTDNTGKFIYRQFRFPNLPATDNQRFKGFLADYIVNTDGAPLTVTGTYYLQNLLHTTYLNINNSTLAVIPTPTAADRWEVSQVGTTNYVVIKNVATNTYLSTLAANLTNLDKKQLLSNDNSSPHSRWIINKTSDCASCRMLRNVGDDAFLTLNQSTGAITFGLTISKSDVWAFSTTPGAGTGTAQYTFVNKGPRQMDIWYDNVGPTSIASNASNTYVGDAGATFNFNAESYGKTTSGTQVGLKITWSGTKTLTASPQTTNLVVTTEYFFLRIINNSGKILGKVNVNFGLASQTQDNVILNSGSTTYDLGFYKAFSNGNVRIYVDGTTSFYQWNQGEHYTLPGTENQVVTLTVQ